MPHNDLELNISVTFRHTEPTDALRDYASEKLTHCLKKFVSGACAVHVILNVEKRDHIAEVHIHSGQYDMTAKAITEDLYAAIDKVVDNVNAQIKKKKDQLTAHKNAPIADVAALDLD